MILYRKAPSLRIVRESVPEPPYWAATTIAPYSARRGAPVAIDYVALTATAPKRLEVEVCEDVRDALERAARWRPSPPLRGPSPRPAGRGGSEEPSPRPAGRRGSEEPSLREAGRGGSEEPSPRPAGRGGSEEPSPREAGRGWREAPGEGPILIDAAESAELVYRRGDEALQLCDAAMFLTSTRGALPSNVKNDVVVIIAAWPLDLARLKRLFDDARARGLRWGVAVPVMFPVTTAADALQTLAEAAEGALFFAALPIETDATARNALADDSETYELLFHGDVEALHVTAERRIAGLAAEIGADDFIIPPRWEQRSNWNGAVLLTLAATRMLAMKHDVETASRIARSARTVAQLDKSLERIAAAAHLSIVESLDEISVDALTEWLDTGKSTFVDHINKQWRL